MRLNHLCPPVGSASLLQCRDLVDYDEGNCPAGPPRMPESIVKKWMLSVPEFRLGPKRTDLLMEAQIL